MTDCNKPDFNLNSLQDRMSESLTRWLLAFMIGIAVGVIAFLLVLIILAIQKYKYSAFNECTKVFSTQCGVHFNIHVQECFGFMIRPCISRFLWEQPYHGICVHDWNQYSNGSFCTISGVVRRGMKLVCDDLAVSCFSYINKLAWYWTSPACREWSRCSSHQGVSERHKGDQSVQF